jgi:hypothetical protein
VSAPGEQAVDRLRGRGGVPGGEHLSQLPGGLAQRVQLSRGHLDRRRLSVRQQHLDHRGALGSAAGREPVTRPRQQDGEDVGRSLGGVVHAAPEERPLTGHGQIV